LFSFLSVSVPLSWHQAQKDLTSVWYWGRKAFFTYCFWNLMISDLVFVTSCLLLSIQDWIRAKHVFYASSLCFHFQTQRQSCNKAVGCVMLPCRLAFCSILILDVVKKVDVQHSSDWNNDFVFNQVLSWSHQQNLSIYFWLEQWFSVQIFVMSTCEYFGQEMVWCWRWSDAAAKQKGSHYFWAKATNSVEDDLQGMLSQT